jgi:hypothetical protein
MEFYKEGRVFTIAPGTTLDLDAAQYNHKAVFIVSDAATINDIINIKFYTKGVKSAAVPFSPACYIDSSMTNTIFTNAIIPVRLSEISTVGAASSIRVTLFN